MTPILRELGVPAVSIETRQHPHLGAYIVITVDADARQAFEYWLGILERLGEVETPVFVMWTGEVNLEPEEMGRLLAKTLARMNVFLATVEPIDAVELLREA